MRTIQNLLNGTLVILLIGLTGKVQAQFEFKEDRILKKYSEVSGGLLVEFTITDSDTYTISFDASSRALDAQTAFDQAAAQLNVDQTQSSARVSTLQLNSNQDFSLIAAKNGSSVDTVHIVIIPDAIFDQLVKFDTSYSTSSIQTPKEAGSAVSTAPGMAVAKISSDYPFDSDFKIEVDWKMTSCTNHSMLSGTDFKSSPYASSSGYLGFNIQADSTIKDDREIHLLIKDETGKTWDTLVIDVKAYETKYEVTNFNQHISIGGSADFLNNSNKLGAYFDVYVETPALGKSTSSWERPWVIGGQLYSGTTLSVRDTLPASFTFVDETQPEGLGSDSLQFITRSGSFERVRSSRFLSVSGFVRYNLIRKQQSPHQIALLLNYEFVERTVETESDFVSSEDQTFLGLSQEVNTVPRSVIDNLGRTDERSFSEGLTSLGLRYQFDNDDYRFYIENLVGYTFYDLAERSQLGEINPSRVGFNTHFAIIAKKYGLKLGGDLRGKIIGSERFEDNGLQQVNSKPLFTMFLTKSFNIGKLAEYVSK